MINNGLKPIHEFLFHMVKGKYLKYNNYFVICSLQVRENEMNVKYLKILNYIFKLETYG